MLLLQLYLSSCLVINILFVYTEWNVHKLENNKVDFDVTRSYFYSLSTIWMKMHNFLSCITKVYDVEMLYMYVDCSSSLVLNSCDAPALLPSMDYIKLSWHSKGSSDSFVKHVNCITQLWTWISPRWTSACVDWVILQTWNIFISY